MKIDLRKLIIKRRKQLKMSVPELARQTGLNHQTLYNYLSGKTELGADSLEKVFQALNIKIQ